MFKKIIILVFLIITFFTFNFFDIEQYLNFEYIKVNQELLQKFYQNNKMITVVIFFIIYVLTTALSIPGATILTLLGGAVFGFSLSLIIISFASTVGATLAFQIGRTLLRDLIEKYYGETIKRVNKGIEKDGAFYLFTMRLVPIFPFFVINLVMGLTNIKMKTFFLVSQVGMLAGTAIYVNAGVQLSELESIEEVMSIELIGSLLLLGFFPLLTKKIIQSIRV